MFGWELSWTKPHWFCLVGWVLGPALWAAVRIYLAIVDDGMGDSFRSHPEACCATGLSIVAGGFLFLLLVAYPVHLLPEYWCIMAFWIFVFALMVLGPANLDARACTFLLMAVAAGLPLLLTLVRAVRSVVRRQRRVHAPAES